MSKASEGKSSLQLPHFPRHCAAPDPEDTEGDPKEVCLKESFGWDGLLKLCFPRASPALGCVYICLREKSFISNENINDL